MIPAMGLPGAALSLLLIDVLMMFLVLRTSLRQLNDTLPQFLAGVFTVPRFPARGTTTATGATPRPSLDAE
jgi:hypothetical protein